MSIIKGKGETENKEGDDIEEFDELERQFHRTVQQLITDQSLSSFRTEYEKLHEQLVKSHDANGLLIDKCRSLNNDILANASKVSSIMSLSQNDQRTITGLRHEFEKAWKLVELSQEKEMKSKEVIETLKGEVVSLSRLVERGGTLFLAQDNSLDEVKKSVESLKSEIKNQADQLVAINSSLQNARDAMSKINETKEQFENENKESLEQIAFEKAKSEDMGKEIEKIHDNIKITKDLMIESQNTIKLKVERISKKKEDIIICKRRFDEELHNKTSETEDLSQNKQSIEKKKKYLSDQHRIRDKTNAKANDIQKRYDEHVRLIEIMNNDLSKINEEIKALSNVNSDIQSIYTTITNEKTEFRANNSKFRNEIYLLLTDLKEINSKNLGLKRVLDKNRKEITHISNTCIDENKETEMVEGQAEILSKESNVMRYHSQMDRGLAVRLTEEIEEYASKRSAARSVLYQVKEEIRFTFEKHDEKSKQLIDIYEMIKHNQALNEAVQNERDIVNNQLQKSISENSKLENDILEISEQIKILKEDIRKKDKLCLEAHIGAKRFGIDISKISNKIRSKNALLNEMADSVTEMRNKIQKHRHLLMQTELENKKQEQVVTDLKFVVLAIEQSVTKSMMEAKLLREKAKTVHSIITMESEAFSNKQKQIEFLKLDLQNLVSVTCELQEKVIHKKALQADFNRLSKSLVLESSKSRALEDDLEKPINIHRWRFLEATNPELSHLLQMSRELRDRLIILLYRLDRYKLAKKKVSHEASHQMIHLKSSTTYQVREEFQFLTEILKQKNQQCNSITQNLSIQQNTVEEQKSTVLSLREMLREEKSEYYSMKKKADEIRASTALGNQRDKEPSIKSPEPRYIGGGFSVTSGSPGHESEIEYRSLSQNPSPHIYTPKAKSALKRKLPTGWNPKRGPISPYLPTVNKM